MKDNMKPIFKAATQEQIAKRPNPVKLWMNDVVFNMLTIIRRRVLDQKFYECKEKI